MARLAVIAKAGCVFLVIARAPAIAGETPEAPPLRIEGASRGMTIEEALAFAHAHQPVLRRALARVSAASADTQIARAQWLPGVGLTVQAFEGTTNNTTAAYVGAPKVDLPRIGGTKVAATGAWSPSTSTLAAVGVQQEIFDFGRIATQAAVADVSYEGERLRADADGLRIDLLIRESYFAVKGAKAVLRAAEDAYRRAGVHRDMAAAQVRSGLHEPIELTRAEADLTRFDVGRIRAMGSLRTAQAALAAAVGVEDRLLDAAGEVPPLAPAPPLDVGLRQAAERDPFLQEARSRVRGAEALAHAIAAETRPDLALTATFSGRGGSATPSSGSVSDTHGLLPLVPNWDVGVLLRWSLYDPVVVARSEAAVKRVAVARADVDVLSQQETTAIEQAYTSLAVSQAALVSLQQASLAAQANYAQAEARFKAGLSTSLELSDAEILRTDAEIQLAMGQFEAQRSRAVIGRLIAERP